MGRPLSSIIGVGCDLVDTQRIVKALDKHGEAFLDKIFTKQEQDYCTQFKNVHERLAARFAAKEAVSKSLGTGFGRDLAFLDIEISNQESGKPIVTLSKQAKEHFSDPLFELSISHTETDAIAYVIAFRSLS